MKLVLHKLQIRSARKRLNLEHEVCLTLVFWLGRKGKQSVSNYLMLNPIS